MKKLSDGLERHIDLLISRYPVLDTCRQDISYLKNAMKMIINC